jgi:hypothetical protein
MIKYLKKLIRKLIRKVFDITIKQSTCQSAITKPKEVILILQNVKNLDI